MGADGPRIVLRGLECDAAGWIGRGAGRGGRVQGAADGEFRRGNSPQGSQRLPEL